LVLKERDVMSHNRVVLVTGVAGYLGSRVAARLLAVPDLHVIGLDVQPPHEKPVGLDFVQADVRNALLPEFFKGEGIDVVCHLALVQSDRPGEMAYDVNVMGTIRVVGACAEAGVRQVVLQSSTMTYGARPDNSAFLTEAQPLRGSKRNGTVRDLTEIESFCDGFRRQVPQLAVTILRFAHHIGPQIVSPLTRFLCQPWAPSLLGFDPMVQVIHEEDVVGALVHATLGGAQGTYNVAADGVLPLSQLMSIAGKVPLPVVHLGVYWGAGLMRTMGAKVDELLPFDLDYLRYSCVGDTRKMQEELGFVPHYTAAEALREFAGVRRLARYLPEKIALAYDEERLRDIVDRRRRVRERSAEAESSAEQPGTGGDREAPPGAVDDQHEAAGSSAGEVPGEQKGGGTTPEYEAGTDGD
jgi:UDP-glucose 4-epimerase